MAEYDGISEYGKAAIHRLQDAAELIEYPTLEPYRSDAAIRHLRGAMYLAGYAIEFRLKAYILQGLNVKTLEEAIRVAPGSKKETLQRLNSAEGHNLNLLVSLTDLGRQIAADPSTKKAWNICKTWKSTWRYDPTYADLEQAKKFFESVSYFYFWLERQK